MSFSNEIYQMLLRQYCLIDLETSFHNLTYISNKYINHTIIFCTRTEKNKTPSLVAYTCNKTYYIHSLKLIIVCINILIINVNNIS